MVRAYTDRELLSKVQSLPSFKELPKQYWILGVRSRDDIHNRYDDKFYVYYGELFITLLTGTTHSGGYGLKNFFRWNSNGVAHIKSDEWYYDVYRKSNGTTIRHHNSRMPCLRQVGNFLYYRDRNKDNTVDEVGKVYSGVIAANFHTNTYREKSDAVDWYINGWSAGCQVTNQVDKYYRLLRMLPADKSITYCLIKEF